LNLNGLGQTVTRKSMDTNTLILAVLPLVVIILVLEVFALVDLIRRDRRYVRGENKWIWALVIVLVSTLGAILYLTLGRLDEGETSHV